MPTQMYGRALVIGKRSVKVVPRPTWLVTEIAPPNCSTNFFDSARPRPRPCFFVVTKSSKMVPRRSGGMPLPLSAISMIASSFLRIVRITTRP